jgi:hypothetical protein
MEVVYETRDNDPAGMMLVGATGLGKTSALEYFQKCKLKEAESTTDIPVLIINTPAAATPKQVLLDAVEALGGHPGKRPTEAELNRMLRKLLQGRNTRMVVLDEFQHLATASSQKLVIQTGNTIKNLMSDTKIPFVLAGLPAAKSIFSQHPELERRFTQTVELKPLGINTESSRKYFLAYLHGIDAVTEGRCKVIATPEYVMRFWLATKGRLSGISRIIEFAMRGADLDTGITQQDLANGYRLFKPMQAADENNPFLMSHTELLGAVGLKK